MTDPLEGVDEVPVVLAGGGLVGLSTAMFLAQHGVASLAVEQLSGASRLPDDPVHELSRALTSVLMR